MNRNKFLKNSLLSTLFLTSRDLYTSSDAKSYSMRENKSIPKKGPDSFELNEMTIADLQGKMQSGQWTSVSICQLYLKRIQEIDASGIHLNSIIELNPDSL